MEKKNQKLIFIAAGVLAVVVAVLLVFILASGGVKTADVNKLPLVYATEEGLMLVKSEGDTPELINEDYTNYLRIEGRTQISNDGKKLYYIATTNATSQVGTLYCRDLRKGDGKGEVIHENVYAFQISANGKTIVIMEGSGKLLKYNERSESKGSYDYIELSLVTGINAVSDDGKYVLYQKVLKGNTGVYSLSIAKTDFKQNDNTQSMSKEDLLKNGDLDKAPLIISEPECEVVYASSDLKEIYTTTLNDDVDRTSYTLSLLKDYVKKTVVEETASSVYFADEKGTIVYAKSSVGELALTDFVEDANYESDKALAEPKEDDFKDANGRLDGDNLAKYNAALEAYEAKAGRDRIRGRIDAYLAVMNLTKVYSYNPGNLEPKEIASFAGQVILKDTDYDDSIVLANITQYKVPEVKPKLEDISIAYTLFEDLKSQELVLISTSGASELVFGDSVLYNGADLYMDQENKMVYMLADYDYDETLQGTLYKASYAGGSFTKVEKVAENVSAVAPISMKSAVYYSDADRALYQSGTSEKLLDNYAQSTMEKMNQAVVFTGEEGNYKVYVLSGKSAEEIGQSSVVTVIGKGKTFAYYTAYDSEVKKAAVSYYNGKQSISLGENVIEVYDYSAFQLKK